MTSPTRGFSAILLSGIVASAQAPAATAAAPIEGCSAPGQRGPRPAGALGAPGAPGAAARPAGAPAAQGGAPAARQAGGPGGNPDAPTGPPKKRLLIWADTRNGVAQHDIGHAMAVIEELGYKSGAYDTWIRTDSNIISKTPKMTDGKPASGGPSLCNVDAIFFLGHREVDLPEDQRKELLSWVHDSGKGFVSAHFGSTAFMESWPEFGKMLGGEFDNHPWGTFDAHILVTDP